MKDLDFTTLRLFLAVYDARSIARVAEREHLVASAITKRLARLEQDVGTPLLRRANRGMEPTEAGHLLAEKCRYVVGSAQELFDDIESLRGGLSGIVSVTCTAAMASGPVVDDIRDFLAYPDHKRLRVQLHQHGRASVAQMVREGRSALGVMWDVTDTTGLQTFPYRNDHIAAVVHRSHPLAGRTSIAYDEAAEHETVRVHTTRATEAMLERTGGIARAAWRNRVEVPTFVAALRMVSGGHYVAMVPAGAARLHAASLGLEVIPLSDAWALRRHVVACLDEASLAPAALAMLRHLTAAAWSADLPALQA